MDRPANTADIQRPEIVKYKFVARVVRNPWRTLCTILVIALLFAIVGISTAYNKGDELFVEGKNYDLGDIRSRRRDAHVESANRLRDEDAVHQLLASHSERRLVKSSHNSHVLAAGMEEEYVDYLLKATQEYSTILLSHPAALGELALDCLSRRWPRKEVEERAGFAQAVAGGGVGGREVLKRVERYKRRRLQKGRGGSASEDEGAALEESDLQMEKGAVLAMVYVFQSDPPNTPPTTIGASAAASSATGSASTGETGTGPGLLSAAMVAKIKAVEDAVTAIPEWQSMCSLTCTNPDLVQDPAPGEPKTIPTCIEPNATNTSASLPRNVSKECELPFSPLNLLFPSYWDRDVAKEVTKALETPQQRAEYTQTMLVMFQTMGRDAARGGASTGANMSTALTGLSETQIWALGLAANIANLTGHWDGQGAALPEEDMPLMARLVATVNAIHFYSHLTGFFVTKAFTDEFTPDLTGDTSASASASASAAVAVAADVASVVPALLYSRSIIFFGQPLGLPYKKAEDEEKVKDYFNKHLATHFDDMNAEGQLEVLYFNSAFIFEIFLQIMSTDMMRAFGSVTFVGIYLRIFTGNCFVTLVGMLEIFLSLPCAYFLYSSVLQLEYFDGLNALCVFIVLAIGADDIFIFMDAYKMSAYQSSNVLVDLETRMSWVWHRASVAMLITSATTMAAFLSALSSPLCNMQSFGIFAALVILCDYVLVISLFCTAVVIYHNHFEGRACCCLHCDVFCTPRTAEPHEDGQTVVVRRGEPPGETWRPSTERAYEAALARERKAEAGGGASADAVPVVVQAVAVPVAKDAPAAGVVVSVTAGGEAKGGTGEVKKRPVEKFFEGPFSDLILNQQKRAIIMGVFFVWFIVFAIQASSIKPASTQEQFLPETHPLMRFVNALNENFGASAQDEGMGLAVLWGLKPISRDGVSILYDPMATGQLRFDDAFSAALGGAGCVAAVRHLEWACNHTKAQRFVMLDSDGDPKCECAVEMLAAWARSVEQVAVTQGAWPPPSDDKCAAWVHDWGMHASDRTLVGYSVAEEKPLYMGMRWESNVIKLHGYVVEEVAREHYEEMEEFVDQLNAAPTAENSPGVGVENAFQTDVGERSRWNFMHNQKVYRDSASSGAAIGMLLATTVIFLATFQPVLAFAAAISIGGTMVSVIGMMVIMGWELGVVEAVLITVTAGFSVDYVVHLAHAYNHVTPDGSGEKGKNEKSKSESAAVGAGVGGAPTARREQHGVWVPRERRVRVCLGEMGVSVFSGMMTSVLAAMWLFGCLLQFFYKFGVFLCMTIFFSWLWANFLFTGLVAQAGPEDERFYRVYVEPCLRALCLKCGVDLRRSSGHGANPAASSSSSAAAAAAAAPTLLMPSGAPPQLMPSSRPPRHLPKDIGGGEEGAGGGVTQPAGASLGTTPGMGPGLGLGLRSAQEVVAGTCYVYEYVHGSDHPMHAAHVDTITTKKMLLMLSSAMLKLEVAPDVGSGVTTPAQQQQEWAWNWEDVVSLSGASPDASDDLEEVRVMLVGGGKLVLEVAHAERVVGAMRPFVQGGDKEAAGALLELNNRKVFV